MATETPKRCCPTDAPPAKCEYNPAGEPMYITGPLNSRMGIVLVSDIFGMHHNSHRYADALGKAGFLVVMPDFFGKKVWDDETFPPDFESEKWKEFYKFCGDFELHRPKARKAIALLRHLGCVKVATMGLCWGSQIAFDMSGEGLTDAAATAHPSLLTADAVRAAKHPVCILPSKDEPPFEDIEAAVWENRYGNCMYKRFSHLDHGFFGCRFDHDSCSNVQRKELEEATAASIAFFQKVLKD